MLKICLITLGSGKQSNLTLAIKVQIQKKILLKKKGNLVSGEKEPL